MTATAPAEDPGGPADDDGLDALLAWLTTWPRDITPRWWDLRDRRPVDRLLTPLRPRARVRGLWLE